MSAQPRFITLEGGEGVGKSTQLKALHAALAVRGIDCVITREPGGSQSAEAIRNISLTTAARTLLWGGCAFTLFGVLALAFPAVAEFGISTPLPFLGRHTLGLPFALVVFTVAGVGVTSFISATQASRRQLVATGGATVAAK